MNLLVALEISLLFVCTWGLIAVLLTGQFNTLVILACIGALIFGYRKRKSGWLPSPLLANLAAVLVFAAAGVIFLTSLNLLIATVYLFLFLQVTKYITRRNLAEIRWCYLISLFHVIGASVITTAITFGFMLLVYIFLMLVSLRLYVMAREWEDSAAPVIKPEASHRPRLVLSTIVNAVPAILPSAPRSLLRTSIMLTIIIAMMAAALFSAIPRLATQNLFQAYGPAPDEPAVSAFSENVEFGAFTEIQQDDAVALFVQPIKNERPSHVRMRGVALDSFDGKAWRRTNSFVVNGSRYYEYVPLFTTRIYPESNWTYRVIQPPGVTNFLFGDSFPSAIHVPAPFQFSIDRMAQAVYLDDMPPKEFQYEVESMHEDLSARRDPAKVKLVDRPVENLLFSTGHEWGGGFHGDVGDVIGRWGDDWVERMDEFTSETWAIFVNDRNATGTEQNNNGEESRARRWWREHRPGENGDGEWERDRALERERWREWRRRRDGETTDSRFAARDGLTTESLDSLDAMQVFEPDDEQRYWGRGRGEFRPRTPRERLHRYLTKCLEVPEILATGRVPALAVEWTEDAETTFSKAMAIESRLRNDFGYTLTPTAKGNFIDDFLFEVREGHCEYFATSMAILLRNIGIPSRVVNGFYSSEWNAISGNFTVRQRDAHSWVEAWMGDDYGWMTFDPTPPAGVSRRSDQVLLQTLFRVMDAVRVRWYRYVVDYSISDQVTMVQKIMRWRRSIMRKLSQAEIMGISSDDRTKIELGAFSGEIDWRPVALSALIILLLIGWQAGRWLMRRRSNRYSDVRFYDELLKILARRGITIAPGQTPREFAHHVSGMNAQWQNFTRATEIYYARRYSGTGVDPDEYRIISELKRAFRERKNHGPRGSHD